MHEADSQPATTGQSRRVCMHHEPFRPKKLWAQAPVVLSANHRRPLACLLKYAPRNLHWLERSTPFLQSASTSRIVRCNYRYRFLSIPRNSLTAFGALKMIPSFYGGMARRETGWIYVMMNSVKILSSSPCLTPALCDTGIQAPAGSSVFAAFSLALSLLLRELTCSFVCISL